MTGNTYNVHIHLPGDNTEVLEAIARMEIQMGELQDAVANIQTQNTAMAARIVEDVDHFLAIIESLSTLDANQSAEIGQLKAEAQEAATSLNTIAEQMKTVDPDTTFPAPPEG